MSPPNQYKFNVFGVRVAVVGAPGQWKAYYLGSEGKRRAADFVVPADLADDEIREYLADLFHENATPANNSVEPLAG
ncbi:MAG: hypothetical protein ACLGI6_02340 [Gammaproteobacteria bacterium]